MKNVVEMNDIRSKTGSHRGITTLLQKLNRGNADFAMHVISGAFLNIYFAFRHSTECCVWLLTVSSSEQVQVDGVGTVL